MNWNDVALVLDLACLTEPRGPGEQAALLRVALAADDARGDFDAAFPRPPTLVANVRATYTPAAGTAPVDFHPSHQAAYDRLCASWQRCRACGEPQGRHWPDGACPRPTPVPDLNGA